MELFFVVLLLLLSSVPLFLHFFRSPTKKKLSDAGDFRSYPIIGNLPQFIRHRHRFLDWMTDLLAASPTNTITFRRLGNVRGVITANPSNVEHILKSNFDNYPKGARFHQHLRDFLGRGIFNADGDLWRVQRKTASFEFNTRSLRNFVVANVQREISDRLLPLLHRAAATSTAIDIQDVLERFAFDNVCKVAFNEDPACLAAAAVGDGLLMSQFAQDFKEAAELSAGRFRFLVPKFWVITRFLNIGSERRLTKCIATVHDFAMRIIRSRKKEKSSGAAGSAAAARNEDLLSRFLANEESSDDDEFLRDIVISFILAGRDTTSSALTWFFWLLSQWPSVEHKIREEILAVRTSRHAQGKNKEAFEFEELREMQYLQAAISESMRLYPPVAVNSTACMADDVLPDGTEVKKGMFVSYNSYAMGRMERIWGEDCREFKPERWLNGDGGFRPESPYRFLAFHAGPRMCLGKEMAYIQMKSIVACVLERFKVDVIAGEGPGPALAPKQILSLTLRAKGGLWVRIGDRCTTEIH